MRQEAVKSKTVVVQSTSDEKKRQVKARRRVRREGAIGQHKTTNTQNHSRGIVTSPSIANSRKGGNSQDRDTKNEKHAPKKEPISRL
jgi:hypothetical protein